MMTPDEEVAFEHTILKSPEMHDELEEAHEGLTALYETLSNKMPAPRKNLKEKILQKATGNVSMTSPYAIDEFVLLQKDSQWVNTNITGIQFRMLYEDADGRTMLLARLAPGASLPSHRRLGTEECYVISGDFWADGQKLGAGDFIAGLAGDEPDPVYSEGGCELLLKMPIPREIFPN